MDLEATMDDVDVIVIDMGSGVTKIGFSGEDAPRGVVPTVTGVLDDRTEEGAQREEESGNVKRKSFVGETAYKGDVKDLCHPCVRGTLDLSTDATKDAIERLFHHAFKSCLNVDPEEFGILVLDSPTAPVSTREWVAELLFEKFKAKSVGMFPTAVMSLFSTGKTRGLVLESGAGVTHAVPVFEGYGIPHAIFKMDVAGADVTEELYRKCVQAGIPGVAALQGVAKTKVMDQMKQKLCQVVVNYNDACLQPDPSDEEHRSFELPDGSIVQIPHEVRYAAAEILFTGEKTMHGICNSALHTVDVDFRNELMQSVVVAGGTSMLPGLATRLQQEIAGIEVFTDSQRRNAAWIGGSMFASFSTFEHFQITKSDYEEGKVDLTSLVSRKTY